MCRVNSGPSWGGGAAPNPKLSIKIINYFEKWFDYFETICLRKLKNGIQILVGPAAFLELVIETCKNIVWLYVIISNTLQIFLVLKGAVWGICPLRSYENFAIFKPNLSDLMHTFR